MTEKKLSTFELNRRLVVFALALFVDFQLSLCFFAGAWMAGMRWRKGSEFKGERGWKGRKKLLKNNDKSFS